MAILEEANRLDRNFLGMRDVWEEQVPTQEQPVPIKMTAEEKNEVLRLRNYNGQMERELYNMINTSYYQRLPIDDKIGELSDIVSKWTAVGKAEVRDNEATAINARFGEWINENR